MICRRAWSLAGPRCPNAGILTDNDNLSHDSSALDCHCFTAVYGMLFQGWKCMSFFDRTSWTNSAPRDQPPPRSRTSAPGRSARPVGARGQVAAAEAERAGPAEAVTAAMKAGAVCSCSRRRRRRRIIPRGPPQRAKSGPLGTPGALPPRPWMTWRCCGSNSSGTSRGSIAPSRPVAGAVRRRRRRRRRRVAAFSGIQRSRRSTKRRWSVRATRAPWPASRCGAQGITERGLVGR